MRRLSSLLILLLVVLPVPQLSAQAVRDSVQMTRKVYSWHNVSANGYNCGAYIYATWPDVLLDMGLPGGYSRYSRVAVGGLSAHYVPYGYGEAKHDPSRNLIVPEGYLAHAPQLGGHGSGGGTGSVGCANALAGAQSSIPNGPMRVLNAAPFQLTDWYAVFTIPSGRPLALFIWDQRRGLDIEFDGSFESKQSREADATAPGGKRPVASYAWDFGDGKTGSGARPTHTYEEPGTYTVVLTVTDDDGETAERTEQVAVKGGILSVRVAVEQTELAAGDTVTLVATVTNIGSETVNDISADRVFTHIESYPSAANIPGDRFQEPELEAVGETDRVTFATLEPDDSFEVRARYRVKTVGKYRPAGTTTYEPIETEVESSLTQVTAKTENGEAAQIVDACEEEDCDNAWKVIPEEYTFQITFKAAPRDGLAAQEVTSVPSGLVAGPSGIQSVIARHRVRTADMSDRLCRSGCVEVEVVVLDGDGQPADNVEVVLSAPLIPITKDFGAVTSGQRGRFCNFDTDATGTRCGNPLRGFTDAEGRLHRTFLTPGVISDVPVEIKAEPYDGNIAGDDTRTLTITPNVVRELTIDISDDASASLMAALAVRGSADGLQKLGELPATFCKAIGNAFGAGVQAARNVDLGFLSDVPADALDWGCGKLPSVPFSDVIGFGKPFAELVPLVWLLESTQLPGTGLAMLDKKFAPPWVQVRDDFTPHVSDALAAIAAANTAPISPFNLLRGSVPVRIYEVSHLTDTSTDLANTEKSTYGLYVDIGGQGKLVRAGYDARVWLQEASLMLEPASLNSGASAGDTEISASGGENPPALDKAGVPTTPADSIKGGDFIALGEGASTEVVQVWRVEGEVIHLTTPLRHSHAAGEALFVVGHRDPAAPERPLAFAPTGDMMATEQPLLEWTALVPALGYDVQIGRDTTFAVLVQEHDGLTADTLQLDGLTPGERYAWRVRARNLIGEGEWSRAATFVALTPVSNASESVLPAVLALQAAVPNPFRTSTTLTLEVPHAGPATVEVFDALGRRVAVLHEGALASGEHALRFDANGLAGGVYLVRAEAAGTVVTQHVVLLR